MDIKSLINKITHHIYLKKLYITENIKYIIYKKKLYLGSYSYSKNFGDGINYVLAKELSKKKCYP